MEKLQTVSVSLLPGQISWLQTLAEKRSERLEFASRSALVRQALNVGIRTLMEEEQRREIEIAESSKNAEGSHDIGPHASGVHHG